LNKQVYFREKEEGILEYAKKDLKITFVGFSVFFFLYLFIFLNNETEFFVETTGMFSAIIETTVPIP